MSAKTNGPYFLDLRYGKIQNNLVDNDMIAEDYSLKIHYLSIHACSGHMMFHISTLTKHLFLRVHAVSTISRTNVANVAQ